MMKMWSNIRLSAALMAGAMLPAISVAQWSPDPFENMMVRDTSGMIVVPHIAVNPGGGTYVSWYSATENLRFDVYLQYFDKQGFKQWPEPGLLVSNHETDTWVSDYGLTVDQEGCAVLVTQDQRNGNSDAFAYRITPDGQMKWGPDGINLTNDEYNNYTPQVIAAPENSFIFLNNMYPPDTTQAWMLNLKKISQWGNLLWDKTLAKDMMDLYFGRMLITDNQNLIISYLQKDIFPDTVLGQAHYIHVFLQKFDLSGNSLWPEPVQADSGDVMMYGALYTIPYLANDGVDGAYVVWQSFADDSPTTLVNHVDADGNLTWPGHGIPVSTNTYNQHTSPAVFYNADIYKLFVLWLEYHYDGDNLTDCWGIAGQKFNEEGERLWSDTARFLIPLLCATDSAYTEMQLSAGPANSMFFTYEKSYLQVDNQDTMVSTNIYGCLIDAEGNYLWSDEKVPVSLASGEKFHSVVSRYESNQWIIAWEDQRAHSDDPWNSGIYAQNIAIDGNLGPVRVSDPAGDMKEDILAYPNPFNDDLFVRYTISRASEVSVYIYDNPGKCIINNELGMRKAGTHEEKLFLNNLKDGIYFLKLQADDKSVVLKLVKNE